MNLINSQGFEYKTQDAQIEEGSWVSKKYVVRLIQNIFNKKTVAGEFIFNNYPNEGELKYCLASHPGTFAVIEEIYTLEEELPFK